MIRILDAGRSKLISSDSWLIRDGKDGYETFDKTLLNRQRSWSVPSYSAPSGLISPSQQCEALNCILSVLFQIDQGRLLTARRRANDQILRSFNLPDFKNFVLVISLSSHLPLLYVPCTYVLTVLLAGGLAWAVLNIVVQLTLWREN